jgi:hypothetical protein
VEGNANGTWRRAMKPVTNISAFLLALISLGHLLRLIFAWGITINQTAIPMWPSMVVFLLFGSLAVLLWRESRGERPGGSSEKPQVGPTDFL